MGRANSRAIAHGYRLRLPNIRRIPDFPFGNSLLACVTSLSSFQRQQKIRGHLCPWNIRSNGVASKAAGGHRLLTGRLCIDDEEDWTDNRKSNVGLL